MQKIIVIGRPDETLSACLQNSDAFQFIYAETLPEPMPEAACVLLVQEFAGAALSDMARTLRYRGIPSAVLTPDGSEENQARLLDAGIDRFLVLPLSPALLQKWLSVMLGNMAAPSADTSFDLFLQATDTESKGGAYVVQEADFRKIYRFVQRLQLRMDKQAQLVTFRFHTRLNTPAEPGTVEDAFPIVQKCLRRGDIACMYGETILAILMGADESGGRVAADRIIQTYQAFFCNSIYDMKYEIRKIEEA